MTEVLRPRKEIEITVQVYAEMVTDPRTGDEQPVRVIGAGQHPERGKPWSKWLEDLKRLGCKVNDHWHSVELTEKLEKPLVEPVRGEAARTIAEAARAEPST